MVEMWLCQVESLMVKSMRVTIFNCLDSFGSTERKEWMITWPGQIVLCCDCIIWTSHATEAIKANKLPHFYKECVDVIANCVMLIRGVKLRPDIMSTVEALIVIDVHGKDLK